MLGRFIRVVRPDGWVALLVHVGTTLAAIAALVPVLLARIPQAWMLPIPQWAVVLRTGFALGVLLVLSGVRTVVYLRLRTSPFLWRGSLTFLEHGQRRRIVLSEVDDVYIELAPPPVDQMVVVKLADGSTRPLCPLRWSGAPALFKAVRRAVLRRRRRRGTGANGSPSKRPRP